MRRLRFCSSWAFLRFGLCAVISLGLIFGGSIGVKASSVSSGDVLDNENPIVFYDGISTFAVNDTTQTAMIYFYQWNTDSQVDELAYYTTYSLGANLISSASYHSAEVFFYNQSFGNGEITLAFDIDIPNTDRYSEMPIVVSLIDSSGNQIEHATFSLGYHSVVFSGDYSDIITIKIRVACWIEGGQFDITVHSLDFEEINEEEDSKNIFELLKDFCGNFFTKIKESFKMSIVDSLKGLFVPDNEFFSDYWDRLNTFFSEKLGALYVPIEILITLFESIENASSETSGITFPGIKWEDTYIIEPQVVSLSSILGDLPELADALHFVTGTILVGAVLLLLQNKLKEMLTE